MDGLVDGWMCGRTDGRKVGRMDPEQGGSGSGSTNLHLTRSHYRKIVFSRGAAHMSKSTFSNFQAASTR